jgi:hypothetical protein
VDGGGRQLSELLRIAAAARSAGDGDATRAAYSRAYSAAREAGDVDAMTVAALGLAEGRGFGTFPGQGPALLHEAYRLANGDQRARVAVALARMWVYGGDAARAVGFAAEAVDLAESSGAPALLADALDALLLTHWGPDDLAERLRISRRLEDVAVHLPDVEARLTAYLWCLTTAVETLDLPAVQRQLRALDGLAQESGSARVRFFAAARRGMYALLTDQLEAAGRARTAAVAAGAEAGEADTHAIDRTLSAGIARQRSDVEALAREAELYEEFGTGEGVVAIAAEAALLWLTAGRPDRAEALLHQLAGAGFAAVPRDVDWLLIVTSLTEVAAATGAQDLTAAAVDLLRPYAGRGVVNAGAAAFAGVVDDSLSRGLLALGQTEAAAEYRSAAAAAYRRLAAGWWLRRLPSVVPVVHATEVLHLHPVPGGLWRVGPEATGAVLPDMKGLHYLRLLLGRPGVEVSALDLSDAAAGHPRVQVADGDLGAALDAQALAAYRRRLSELDEEIAEASAWSDSARLTRVEAEREALIHELAAASGLGGRWRHTGDARERARIAVRKAVASALSRIDEVDRPFARLLRNCVTTGAFCRYDADPGRPVQWVLEDGP